MLVKRNGIFKTIQSSEYGIYQKAGFQKVADKVVQKEPNKEIEPELKPLDDIIEDKELIKDFRQDNKNKKPKKENN